MPPNAAVVRLIFLILESYLFFNYPDDGLSFNERLERFFLITSLERRQFIVLLMVIHVLRGIQTEESLRLTKSQE